MSIHMISNETSPKITLFTNEATIIEFTSHFAKLSYKNSDVSVCQDVHLFTQKLKREDSDLVIVDFKQYKTIVGHNISPDNYAGDWIIVNVPDDGLHPGYYWIDMGFSGLLYQRNTIEDLFKAIKVTYEKGQLWFSRNDLAQALRNYMKSGISNDELSERIGVQFSLTPKETDICRLMLSGFTNSQIANKKNVSVYTVKNHVAKVLSKLDISSRKELLEKKYCEDTHFMRSSAKLVP